MTFSTPSTPRLSARRPLMFAQGTSPHRRYASNRLLAGPPPTYSRILAPSTYHSLRSIFSSKHDRSDLFVIGLYFSSMNSPGEPEADYKREGMRERYGWQKPSSAVF